MQLLILFGKNLKLIFTKLIGIRIIHFIIKKQLISGLIKPNKGKILLDKKIIDKPSSRKGMVFQKPRLFPWLSVGENVGFSGSLKNEETIDEKEIDKMLKKVGLIEFKNSYPKELSGGMAQRVSLIRTMISKPEIFLLDEPLGSLDAFTRMNMQDEILNLWQEIKNLMIMVTHDVEEAVYMSTKIIIMEPRPVGKRSCRYKFGLSKR